MRTALATFIVAALLAASGCGPVKPLTESEFKGFCYQYSGGRFDDCDTISVCGDYLTVMGLPQPSRAKCMEGCQAVYEPQFMRYATTGCAGAAQYARDWCNRYCQSNYPQ